MALIVSPSKIHTFGECANRFRYEYVLKLEAEETGSLTALGSVWHYAAEVLEQFQDLDQAIATFSYYWDHPEEVGTRIDFYHPRTTHEGLRARGVEMLERLHGLEPWKRVALVGTEIRFEVPLGPHTLRGVVDKMYLRHGKKELQVIDYKTGYRVPKRLRYNLQFTAYIYATTCQEFWDQVPGFEDFLDRYDYYKRVGQWFHARENKMFSAGSREESDYRRLRFAVDQMEGAIDADVFPLSIVGELCGYCPYLEICGSEVDDD